MEQDLINAAAVAGTSAPDLSMWALILRADIVVKAVIILLVASSVWCWAIIFEKLRRIRTVVARAEGFEETFWSGGSLDDLYDRMGKKADHPMAVLFTAAMREWRRPGSMALAGRDTPRASIRGRIGQVLRLTIRREQTRDGYSLHFTGRDASSWLMDDVFGDIERMYGVG